MDLSEQLQAFPSLVRLNNKHPFRRTAIHIIARTNLPSPTAFISADISDDVQVHNHLSKGC